MRTRIKEVVDSNGKTNFYPQVRILVFFWITYEDNWYGEVRFDSLERAKGWINYKSKYKTIIHTV